MTVAALFAACAAGVLSADVAVVGGGSAGFAAAYSAAKLGSEVVLIEREKALGGTSTTAGVCNWEPATGCLGVPYAVYRRLSAIPDACGVYTTDRHCCWEENLDARDRFPGALLKVDRSLGYADTFAGHGPGIGDEKWYRANSHGILFEPDAMSRVMLEMLRETGRCTVLTGVSFVKAEAEKGRLAEIVLSDGRRVRAKAFVDATDGVVCRQLGCGVMRGREARSEFDEPGAPEKPVPSFNGATLMFRVTPDDGTREEPVPDDLPDTCWWGPSFPYVFAMTLPCGDIVVNMLPTMRGDEAMKLGPEAATAECRRRVLAEWRWLRRTCAPFRGYRLKSLSPVLAYRETVRIRGDYVLNQNDLIAGLSGCRHPDVIAIADHSMDSHGGGIENGQLRESYGIPYRCLLPKGTENVLIAGRAASFSAIAASSCRLARTMMQIGEAAGVAAHLAVARECALRAVPADEIRRMMREKVDEAENLTELKGKWN